MDRIDKLKLAIKKGFTYNSKTGLITNPTDFICRNKTANGYIKLSLWYNGKRYSVLGHQFAWFVTYDEIVFCIDHKDKDKENNSIDNLRSVTKSQNAMNMKNTKGYTFCSRSKKYIAIIMVNYKKIQLGSFNTSEEAKKCYLDNKNKYHII